MKTPIRIALLAGAVLVAAGGLAAAPLTASAPKATHARGHAGSRLFAEFDLNHDGKITRAEVNRVMAERFAADSDGKAFITAQQYADAERKKLRDRASMMFRRADWNNDGKLSLDEYSGFARASFERLDRTGQGWISCAPHHKAAAGAHAYRRSGSSFCASNDLNHDGKLTHAEFDKSTAAKFAAASHGTGALSFAQFYDLNYARYEKTDARAFARLDTNHDGKLTEAEFAAGEAKMFTRLDTNKDGTITKDEAQAHRGRGRHDGNPERG